MFTRPIVDPGLVSLVAETRLMQVIQEDRFTVKEIDGEYEPSFVSGTLLLAENKTDRRIDVSLDMTNMGDSYTYFGVVNKYPYEEYTMSVVQNILTNPSFQGSLDTTTHFYVNDPFFIPEKEPDMSPTSMYYFTIFAVSQTTGEYVRFVDHVEYQALPSLYIEGYRSNRMEYAVYMDLRIENIYDDYQYEYAARITKDPTQDSTAIDPIDVFASPDMYGTFEPSETTTTGSFNPNSIEGSSGSVYYMHIFCRAKQDHYLISDVVHTNVQYIGNPIIGDVTVALSHITYKEPPVIEDISIQLSENELTYEEYSNNLSSSY